MAKRKITIKKIKNQKISKFKLPKPVSKVFKIKNTAGKQTKAIKIGQKVYKSTSITRGLTSHTPITNKGVAQELKAGKVSY